MTNAAWRLTIVSMPFIALAAACLLMQEVNPYSLAIGTKGTVLTRPGEIVSTANGKTVSVEDLASAASGQPFMYLGESHTNAKHHQLQADVIQALVKAGRNVVVGFEMFTRPNQPNLNPWTLGWYSEEEFIREANWKEQWGFDYALYRPIFNVIRDNHLPMVALNVPREWVSVVGKKGYAGLTDEQRQQLPSDLYLGNESHKQIFGALMGGHPMTGDMGNNIYAAQVLWDEGMADTAIKYFSSHRPTQSTIFVILAGAGHLMYKQGINYRIMRRTGMEGVTVVMTDFDKPERVSRGLADFVYAAPEKTS